MSSQVPSLSYAFIKSSNNPEYPRYSISNKYVTDSVTLTRYSDEIVVTCDLVAWPRLGLWTIPNEVVSWVLSNAFENI